MRHIKFEQFLENNKKKAQRNLCQFFYAPHKYWYGRKREKIKYKNNLRESTKVDSSIFENVLQKRNQRRVKLLTFQFLRIHNTLNVVYYDAYHTTFGVLCKISSNRTITTRSDDLFQLL